LNIERVKFVDIESKIVQIETEGAQPTGHIMNWDYLKERMKILKITTPQLADKSGVSANTIRNLFSGASKDPRVSSIAAIMAALGASYDIFYGIKTADQKPEMSDIESRFLDLEERIMFKRGRIEELGLENERLRAENKAHERTIGNLESMNAKREKELRRHRWIMFGMMLLAAAFAGVAIYLLWELLNPTRGKFKFF